LLPDIVHVPANLTAAATSMVARAASGCRLPISPAIAVPAGVRTGLAVAVPLLAGIGVAAAVPATRRFFDDAGARIVAPVLRDGVAHPDRDRCRRS
jgi:hypothetical protein